MEKANTAANSTAAAANAPVAPTNEASAMANSLPSAPPSYEEAVGLKMPTPSAPDMHAVQSVPVQPPYPMVPPNHVPIIYAAPTSAVTTQQQTQVPEVRVIQHTVTVTLGPNPVKMSCPSCRADIKTTTMSDHQPSAHICCIILCLLGCCLCSCLPYCLSSFLSVHHFCPSCKAYIGTWKG